MTLFPRLRLLFASPAAAPAPVEPTAPLHARLSALSDDISLLRASLVERTSERDLARARADAAEAKFSFCAEQLALERQRNKEMADRLLALTDRHAFRTLRGDPDPAPAATAPPLHPRAPLPSTAGTLDPTRDIEELFRMRPAGA